MARTIGRPGAALLGRSDAFRYFVAAAPGARELVGIGKAWDLTRSRGASREGRLVVVDAPSSGHAVGLLQAPRTFSRLGGPGPIGHQAARIRDFLGDPSRSAIVLVCTPSEMPVTETVELAAAIEDATGRPPDLVIANQVLPDRFDEHEVELIDRALGRERGSAPARGSPPRSDGMAPRARAGAPARPAARGARPARRRAALPLRRGARAPRASRPVDRPRPFGRLSCPTCHPQSARRSPGPRRTCSRTWSRAPTSSSPWSTASPSRSSTRSRPTTSASRTCACIRCTPCTSGRTSAASTRRACVTSRYFLAAGDARGVLERRLRPRAQPLLRAAGAPALEHALLARDRGGDAARPPWLHEPRDQRRVRGRAHRARAVLPGDQPAHAADLRPQPAARLAGARHLRGRAPARRGGAGRARRARRGHRRARSSSGSPTARRSRSALAACPTRSSALPARPPRPRHPHRGCCPTGSWTSWRAAW